MSLGLRHRIIAGGFGALAATRLDRLLAPLSRGRGLILTFHHIRPPRPDPFQPNRLLEITPGYLDTVLGTLRTLGYDIVPLAAVPDRLRQPADRRPFVALTFDDGYRDNAEYAAPILERHGAPWTVFVVPHFASGRGRLWWLELEAVVAARERIRVEIDATTLDLPARSTAEKVHAFATIYALLRAGPEGRLRDTIGALYRDLGRDPDRLVADLCLDWSGIAALAERPGVTVGAHTMSHVMLAKHDADLALGEITGSRTELEQVLGRSVTHLAYPVGDLNSAGPREFALARKAGFQIAVTTRPGHLFAVHAGHLTALPRVSVNGLFQTERALRSLLTGVPFLLWNRGRRLVVG